MESSFTDVEKRFILAEMVKVSQLDVGVLVDFIKSHGVQPNWLDMQLPGGRNMNQCLRAAEVMFDAPMPPPVITPLKRKSLGDLPDHVTKRQALSSPGETSPRGNPYNANVLPAVENQLPSIQPRPNGYAPLAPTPSVSAAPYNPAPSSRRRGRPPKSIQNTWQVSTYPHISPAPIAPSPAPTGTSQPHSPNLRGPPAYSTAQPGVPDARAKKRALPDIAPRPTQGLPSTEVSSRSPAMPNAEFQPWREETSRREYYQTHSHGTESTPREAPAPTHAPILPPPRSPHPQPSPPRESARPALTESTISRGGPPATSPGTVKTEVHTAAPAAS
ncbi:hypothetical protein VTK26DRAFT_8928 [Humicola hyalothermophila]